MAVVLIIENTCKIYAHKNGHVKALYDLFPLCAGSSAVVVVVVLGVVVVVLVLNLFLVVVVIFRCFKWTESAFFRN